MDKWHGNNKKKLSGAALRVQAQGELSRRRIVQGNFI